MPNPSANIEVKIASFVPIANGFCPKDGATPLRITSQSAGARASITNKTTVALKKGGPIDLTFSIVSASGAYAVAGLIFDSGGLSTPPHPGGKAAFELVSIMENELTITYNYNVGVNSWKFYIAIRNASGVLGLIDPDVENSDTLEKRK